jgi:very-short-patch-repair endonuclease
VIEVDGHQHSDSVSDRLRDAFLRAEGFLTLRYTNLDVQQPTSVLEDIHQHLVTDPSPGPSLRSGPPSPTRGEG